MTKFNDSLGYIFICEKSNDGHTEFTDIDVVDNKELFMVSYTQTLQSFDVLNRNGRYYRLENIRECLESEKIQSQLAHNGWFSELDHPFAMHEGEKLSPERLQQIYYPNRCAVIKNPRFEGNLLKARLTTTNNDVGKALAADIVGIEYRPMASLRAIAIMEKRDNKPYINCRRVITYDTVSYASHREADMEGKAVPITKKINTVTESAKDNSLSSADIILPIRINSESVADKVMKDSSVDFVMESFDLTTDDILGVSNDKKQVILKDDRNRIFIGINPNTTKAVEDFLSSF